MPKATDAVPEPQAPAAVDIDGDGELTLNDADEWLLHMFFLPGDWSLWALTTYAPWAARFLDVGPADYGGVLSGYLSVCAWLAALIAAAITYHFIRDADRKLTLAIAQRYDDLLRRLRIGVALLRQRWRRGDAARSRSSSVEFVEDVPLSDRELSVLQLHAELGPGYALSVSDVAHALNARAHPTHALLDRLKQLGLLNRTVGGADGETAYTLTSAGRALLAFKRLAPSV
jgi:DNA-binding MarR family transcriptional regulator